MPAMKELVKAFILDQIKQVNISHLKGEITEEQYNEALRIYTEMYFERVGEPLFPDTDTYRQEDKKDTDEG
jgi:hypothetical protein